MVRGAHHDAHLVGQSRRLWVVLVEVRCPHGRPEVIRLQAQQQLKDLLVGLGVHAAEMLLTPRAERGPLVVDEDAAIFHGRIAVFVAVVVIQFVLMHYWRIGHPVPGRHADAARYLVDAIDGAALVVACNDEVAVNHVDDVGLPFPLDRLDVELLLPDETVDDTALADGADHNTAATIHVHAPLIIE